MIANVINIVILDDERLTADEICDLLKNHGYPAQAFTDPSLYMSWFISDESPILLLLDINMPEISGWGVLSFMKNLDSPKRMYETLIVSARNQSSDFRMAMQSGGIDYIMKPIDPDDLLDSIAIGVEKLSTRIQMAHDEGAINTLRAKADHLNYSSSELQDLMPPKCASESHLRILLALLRNQDEGPNHFGVSIGSAAYATNMSLTSGLRKVKDLCDAGLLRRHQDPADSRRQLVQFTPAGTEIAKALQGPNP